MPEAVPTRTKQNTHAQHAHEHNAAQPRTKPASNPTHRHAHAGTRTHANGKQNGHHPHREGLIVVAWQGASRAPGCKRVP